MNKLKEFGIEENTYKECLKQALRAGEPTYKFLLGEKVCMGCTAHKTICAILDKGLCYLVDDGDKFMCKPWHELRPFAHLKRCITKHTANGRKERGNGKPCVCTGIQAAIW